MNSFRQKKIACVPYFLLQTLGRVGPYFFLLSFLMPVHDNDTKYQAFDYI